MPHERDPRPGHRVRPLAIALLAAVLAAGCMIVDHQQRRWIFMPTHDTWEPGVAAAAGMQEVWIDHLSDHPEQRGQAVRLHGLWLARAEPDAPVLLFLHGVRWTVHASAPRMRQLHALGFSVLSIDYRGFGLSSEALPSETLAAEDARAAWRWLAHRHPQARRFVFGHSLGAALAVALAADVDDEAGVIVEGAFTSAADVLRSTRWGWLPVYALMTQHFDAGSRVATIGSPLLVVHGSADEMVSPALGRALYERALPPKRFVLVDGGEHENTDVVGQAQYRSALRELFGISVAH
ncbi:MAG: alpha/beta fold hydrolase [Burkholderiaceae bacterium]